MIDLVAGRYHATENLGEYGYDRRVARDGHGVADGKFNMAHYHWIYCLARCGRGYGVGDKLIGMNVAREASGECRDPGPGSRLHQK